MSVGRAVYAFIVGLAGLQRLGQVGPEFPNAREGVVLKRVGLSTSSRLEFNSNGSA